MALPLTVIFEDASLLVLNKPSGLLSVPGRGEDKQDSLSARAQAIYPDALVVHRLDMATSGLMLMARGKPAQRILSDAFANRQVTKRYVAVVDGLVAAPATDWGVIDLPIALDWPHRPLRVIDAELGKPSVTRWCISAACAARTADAPGTGRATTRLTLAPVTGRSHQLRVHLAAVGHPILGDALYAPPAVQARASRLLLHACAISLMHPDTGQQLRFECVAPF